MASALLLQLDAPLMSFGGSVVDQLGRTLDFPGTSLLAGLIGNALGYDHSEHEKLERLQARLRYAVRQDCRGQKLSDFQTVDLGQDHLVDTGWTSRGRVEGRAGASSTSTHIRYRDYWVEAIYTLALTLDAPDEQPDLDAIEAALLEPARPLFIGRKPCLPSSPLLLGRTEAPTVRQALRSEQRLPRGRKRDPQVAEWWPADEDEEAGSRLLQVVDERDWANQIHTGRRLVRWCEGSLEGSDHGE